MYRLIIDLPSFFLPLRSYQNKNKKISFTAISHSHYFDWIKKKRVKNSFVCFHVGISVCEVAKFIVCFMEHLSERQTWHVNQFLENFLIIASTKVFFLPRPEQIEANGNAGRWISIFFLLSCGRNWFVLYLLFENVTCKLQKFIGFLFFWLIFLWNCPKKI